VYVKGKARPAHVTKAYSWINNLHTKTNKCTYVKCVYRMLSITDVSPCNLINYPDDDDIVETCR